MKGLMMKRMKQIILALAVVTGISGVMVLPTDTVGAVPLFTNCKDYPDNPICKANGTETASSMVKTVINILTYIIGIVAVIMIIIGGIMYTTSGGDSGKVTTAKNTILYAVVGLVVAILAFTIVNFVLKSI